MELKADLRERYIKKQRDLSEKRLYPSFPRIIKIDTCNVCNYHCVFCPQSKQKNKVGCIDKELCFKLIEDSYRGGGRELCLSMTGEPLINQELESYIRFAKQLGYEYIFLNTNGYFMDENRGVSLIDSGIDSVKVSVNSSMKSYELIHGVDAYERVVENIIAFDQYRKKVGSRCKLYISFVAVKQTLNEVETLKQELGAYVDDIIVMNANSRGGSISEIEECLYAGEDEFSFQYPCSQLFNNIYVTAEGYLIICCQDFENLTVVADLHEEPIIEAWNNTKFTEFRKKYLTYNLKGTLCYNCVNNTVERVIPLTPSVAHYTTSDELEKCLQKRIIELDRRAREKENG